MPPPSPGRRSLLPPSKHRRSRECRQSITKPDLQPSPELRLLLQRSRFGWVCLISVAITIYRVQNTRDIIPSLIKQAAGPVDIQRLTTCQSNYTAAVDAYTKAWSSASSRAYYDVLSWIQVGANEVMHCENIYRMSQPIRQSPITVENHDVVKLSEITLIILSMIESGSTGSEKENF